MIEVAFRHDYGQAALDIAFTAPTPGITVLFGPSGAGKSTVVAALAGLLRPTDARLAIDGAVLCDTGIGLWLPPERRRLGVVFQESRLFPHLSVAGNLRYGMRRAPPGPVGFDAVTALLGIRHLLARRPHTLSGGERQRIAIGRAVLSQPRLLLMDEPLASLDAARREDILPFIAALGRELQIPVVYVTHALAELAALADTVILLRSGGVVASGPPGELSARGDLPLAAADEAGVVVAVTILAHDAARRLTWVQAGAATLLVPLSTTPVGAQRRLLVRAADVVLAAGSPAIAVSAQNLLPGHVRALHPQPERHAVMVEIDLGGGCVLLSRITQDAVARLALCKGSACLALLKSTSLDLLAP